MNSLPPDQEPSAEPVETVPDRTAMPRWVPIAIGVVLVTLAALAVLTGLRYRDNTLVGIIRPQSESRRTAPAPPGEPEAGASRVFSGRTGANVPPANLEIDEQEPGTSVSGGPGGVSSLVRMRARRGMQFRTEPRDAVVYVNDVAVGRASEYDRGEEVYDFAEAGSYNVRLEAPGFEPRHYLVTASWDAPQDIARIEAKLTRAR